jgi:diguanylate cyclase (GGDEF)-like protein
MNDFADQPDGAAMKAERELANLNERVEAMRAVLIQLLQDVVRAESLLDDSQAARLLEANEQLVMTALGAQAEAQTAAGALDEASRSNGLDPLTGLPNRTVLLDRLAHAIANAKRHGKRVALLFLDLNNFKQINDTFGHAAGDQAIQLAADCLSSLVRASDTVSRHGGDEFLILLSEVSQPADAARIAEKVNAALGTYSRIDGHAIRLTASIGITLYPDDGEDPETLIDRADAAMYLAKRQEFGGYVFHSNQTAGPHGAPASSTPPRLTHVELTLDEHKRRHSQLREANERLVLAALGAQELHAAAEQARQRQAELLAMVARELGNPFAPIRLAASMLGGLDAKEPLLSRAQAIIEHQADQMARRVAGLFDPAAPDIEPLAPERRTTDLVAIVTDGIRSCQPEVDRRLQTLTVNVPTGSINVQGDPMLLAQVLTNLLTNATTYTHDGGNIRLSVECRGDDAVMTVSDDGTGIVPQALATIFDPFVRDPRAGAIDEDGLGIGLTVVRAIVEAHGGRVVATSAGIGQGSQFVVTLPASPADAAAPS